MQKNTQKSTEKKIFNQSRILLLSLILACLWGVMLVSYVRNHERELYPPQRHETTKMDAEKWLKAIKSKNKQEAILLAGRMVSDDAPELPNPDYLRLLMHQGLGSLILTSAFNDFDYMRWQDAYTVMEIVNSADISAEPEELKLEALFRKMTSKIKRLPKAVKNYHSSPSISGIWHKKTASTRELCRLFAAIAKQAGYDVQTVSLFSESGSQVHLFCEIRKNKRSYVADPRFNYFAVDASGSLFALESSTIPKIWPEKVANAVKRQVYGLPAEAVDYKLINQRLFSKLSAKMGKDIPLFAQDPQTQIDQYIKKYTNKTQNPLFTYWTFPFNSLMFSADFPLDWKLKAEKPGLNVKKK